MIDTPPVLTNAPKLPSADIAGFELLSELALNLRWSWNHSTDTLWHSLDPVQWALTRNPWVLAD